MHFELCEIWFRALLLNVEINCYEAANHVHEEATHTNVKFFVVDVALRFIVAHQL